MSSHFSDTMLKISGTALRACKYGTKLICCGDGNSIYTTSVEPTADGAFVANMSGSEDFIELKSVEYLIFDEQFISPYLSREVETSADELEVTRNRLESSPEARERLSNVIDPWGDPGDDDNYVMRQQISDGDPPEDGDVLAEDASHFFVNETKVDWYYLSELRVFVRPRFVDQITEEILQFIRTWGADIFTKLIQVVAGSHIDTSKRGQQTLEIEIEEKCWNNNLSLDRPSYAIVKQSQFSIAYTTSNNGLALEEFREGINFSNQLLLICPIMKTFAFSDNYLEKGTRSIQMSIKNDLAFKKDVGGNLQAIHDAGTVLTTFDASQTVLEIE